MTWKHDITKILLAILCFMVFAVGNESACTMVTAESRVWPVGDSNGWTFGVLGWPNYKPFMAGDVLWFKYPPGEHNVVQVHEPWQYSACVIPDNATMWTLGDNRITLPCGMSFFICGMQDHCQKGLKIAVTAR